MGVSCQPVRHNELGVFSVNGQGYMRCYYERGVQRKLIAINKEVEPVYLEQGDDVYCLGKVVGKLKVLSEPWKE